MQPVANDRLDVLRPSDERHVVPGTREHAAEVAADRAGTHHRNMEPGIRHPGILAAMTESVDAVRGPLQHPAVVRRIFVSLGLAEE